MLLIYGYLLNIGSAKSFFKDSRHEAGGVHKTPSNLFSGSWGLTEE